MTKALIENDDYATLGVVVNTGSKSSLTLSKAALVLSSLPVHINNRYNWCDSAFFSIYVHKSVVFSTGKMVLDDYILTQDRPLNATMKYALHDNDRPIMITKTVAPISTFLYFMQN